MLDPPPPPAYCSTPFAGTYTDPVNHPGGKRVIKLTVDNRPAVLKGYKNAIVNGGGGKGEPKSYALPAYVNDKKGEIVIDFTPKGGPKDFVGKGEEGGIRFVRDGNFWPRVEGCE